MKRIFVLITFVGFFNQAYSQTNYLDRKSIDRITDSIYREGMTLYRSEWASWNGTDIFLDKCKPIKSRSGGYLSYDTGKELVNVFYSRDVSPVILATISFPYGFNPANYKLDTVVR